MTRYKHLFGILCVALTFSSSALGNIVLDDALPRIEVLNCGTQCANWTPAKPLKHELPYHMEGPIVPSTKYSEGLVWLQYTVKANGSVGDVVLIYTIGELPMTETAISTVKAWTFEPALLNGKPVDQVRYMMELFPVTGRGLPGAQPMIAAAYANAMALQDKGKGEEAANQLYSVLQRQRLTFFERSLLALPLANRAFLEKNYLEARRLAIIGTMPGTSVLPPAAAAELWRLRILSDLALGEINDALGCLEYLKQADSPPGSGILRIVEGAVLRANNMSQLVVSGKIPESKTELYWHDIYKRTFAFSIDAGSLEAFTLNCAQSTIKSKISLTSEWTVPKSWSGCRIFVTGTPGSIFKIVERDEQSH